MNMIKISKLGAQGDVAFRRIKELPKTAVPVATTGPIVVAHSETMHHHSIDATDGVALFAEPSNPFICYLRLEGVEYADVVHHRSWDTHDTVRLLAGKAKVGTFEIRRQREFTPERDRMVTD